MSKFIFCSASLFLSKFLVSAQLSQMDSIIDIAEKSLEMMNATLPKVRGRNSLSVQFSDLQEYGCWCYFDSLHGRGRGTPVDNFDIECMNLHHMVSCMKMQNCDLTVPSVPVMTMGLDGNVIYDCVSANGGDSCKEAICYTNTWFSKNILKLLLNMASGGELPKYNTYKVSKGFDQSTCKIVGTNPSDIDEEKCCGSYEFNTKRPIRVPSGRRRECCENSSGIFVTYNPDFKKCCSGSVESFGSC